VLLRASNGRGAWLRVLADAEVADLSTIPVLAVQAALAIGEGIAELPTELGVVCVPARLHPDGRLELRVAGPLRPLQRRVDVRGRLQLPLRGTAAPAHRTGLLGLVQRTEFTGRTVDVSAGGLRARLDPPGVPEDAQDFYAVLDGSGQRPVTAVLEAVALRSGLLQARFSIVGAADREHLVHQVFDVQRSELAARRRSDDLRDRPSVADGGVPVQPGDTGRGVEP
jgi:hypothetical protein